MKTPMLAAALPLTALLALPTTSLTADDGATDINQALLECRAVSNEKARLACFDALADAAARKTSHGMAAPAAKKQSASAAPTAATPTAQGRTSPTPSHPESEQMTRSTTNTGNPKIDEFGAEDVESKREERAEKRLEAIEVTVTKLVFDHRGKARFYLSNGQVWEQTDRRKARRFNAPYEAVIERASMGSYMIKKKGSGVSNRVKRLR